MMNSNSVTSISTSAGLAYTATSPAGSQQSQRVHHMNAAEENANVMLLILNSNYIHYFYIFIGMH